jgi:hypothetical protein
MNESLRRNPVFWLMWLIPGVTVVAGLGMVVVAMRDGDRALPAMYHWEGARLDADFERARQAARLGIRATLQWQTGDCALVMSPGPTPPRALTVHFTHSDDAALDRSITLLRRPTGNYSGPCDALPVGRWRVALSDDGGDWMVRATVAGEVTRLELSARDPDGRGT